MYFKLFANCILVKGHQRSSLCDLQRNQVVFIPEILLDLLKEDNAFVVNSSLDADILEYVDLLVDSEYGFLTDTPLLFAEIDFGWKEPGLLSNAILDFGSSTSYDYIHTISQLDEIGCKHLQIRCYESVQDIFVENILNFLVSIKSRILSVEFLLPYSESYTKEYLTALIKKHKRVSVFYIHSSQVNEFIASESSMGHIMYVSDPVISHASCGIINPNYFSINIKTFTESQKHNTCLNRKISIDVNGEIKNCPSMTKSYGNIRDTTLREAMEKLGFKDVWYIHKDQIKICQDCEFRHICTDCRAYIQDPADIYSKPAKCSYDPYTATWGEDNPTNNPLHGQ